MQEGTSPHVVGPAGELMQGMDGAGGQAAGIRVWPQAWQVPRTLTLEETS